VSLAAELRATDDASDRGTKPLLCRVRAKPESLSARTSVLVGTSQNSQRANAATAAGAVDLVLLLAMWWVMMAGMMLPGAAPMILTFATINRRRRARAQPYAPTALFAVGYLLAWGGFSVAATLDPPMLALCWDRGAWRPHPWWSRLIPRLPYGAQELSCAPFGTHRAHRTVDSPEQCCVFDMPKLKPRGSATCPINRRHSANQEHRRAEPRLSQTDFCRSAGGVARAQPELPGGRPPCRARLSRRCLASAVARTGERCRLRRRRPAERPTERAET
jgi:hypothetical protein